MRFTLSTLLAAVLALPVLAQPPRGGDRERERPVDRPKDNPDVERLMNRVKELEKQLGETKGKKEDKKPEGDRKPEKETPEGRKPQSDRKPEEKKPEGRKPEGDRKPGEVQPQPFPPREGPQFGRGPGGPPFGPMQPEGGNPFNPAGGSQREGRMGSGMMGGGMMGGGMFPGMEALNKDEQEMFQKLMTKMRGAPQKSSGQGDRKPNIEERLERLEGMMQKLMQKLDR